MSDSLWPHELQHSRLPHLPGAGERHSTRDKGHVAGSWHSSFTISWSLVKFMSIELMMPSNHLILCHPILLHPLSFPASGFFPKSQLFTSVGQSNGTSASASVFPMNIQGWFLLGWTGLISLQSKGLSGVFSSTTVWEHKFFGAQPNIMAQHSHPYMTTGKTISLTIQTFVGKVISLLFNMLSRFVLAFLPRSKYLLISGLQSPSTVILETKKIKSVTLSIFSCLFAMK